ncbi:MAG: zinc ribbon domain-containing protein [Pseudomonadota bacterium]
MPTYEYHCKKCAKTFEFFQKITEKPLDKCPDCGNKIKRLISGGAFALKGGGWYKDGYSSATSKKSDANNKQVNKKEK